MFEAHCKPKDIEKERDTQQPCNSVNLKEYSFSLQN